MPNYEAIPENIREPFETKIQPQLGGHVLRYQPATYIRNETNDILFVHEADTASWSEGLHGERASKYVVKFPSGKFEPHSIAKRFLDREVCVVSKFDGLQEDGIDPGFEMPHYFNSEETRPNSDDDDRPGSLEWAAFSYVPGITYTQNELRRLLDKNQMYRYGRHIGRVIVDFSNLADPGEFDTDMYLSHGERIPPKGKYEYFQSVLGTVDLNDGVWRIFGEIYSELQNYNMNNIPKLNHKPILGHTDWHVDNQRIVMDEVGNVQSVGVIDLDKVQASSFEAELRFAAQLHPQALFGAMDAIQEMTGRQLDEGLISFWHLMQIFMQCVQSLRNGYPVGSAVFRCLQEEFPDSDWGEIDWLTELKGKIAEAA